MVTSASIGLGGKYEVWDASLMTPAFVEVGEVTNVDPGSDDADLVDATHLGSTGRRREYIGGLIDGGEGTLELNWVPGSATDVLLRGLLTSGATVSHRLTAPNGVRVTYPGIIRGMGRTVPVGDKMVQNVTIKKAGDETWDTATATLSSPTGTQTGATTASLSVTTDESRGIIYAGVFPTASTPSEAAIIAGTGATWAGQSPENPGTGSEAFSATGLTTATAYKAHFVQVAYGNNSNVATSTEFTTA